EGNFVVGREGSISKKHKKTNRFCWRNGPFLVEENSRPPPNTPNWLIAKSSEDENEPILLSNQFNKKRVRSDVVEPLSK
ncbi:2300_t:CDS:2, partial [Gigaspora rosea]